MVQLCLIFFFQWQRHSGGRMALIWACMTSQFSQSGRTFLWTNSGKQAMSQDCLALFAVSEIAGVVTWPNHVKLLGNHSSDNGWLCEYVTEIQMVKLSTETHEVTKKHLLSPINTRSWSKHMVILQFTNAKCSFSQRSVQFLVQTCTLTRVLHLRSVITVNKYTF